MNNGADAVLGADCSPAHNVLFPQSAPGTNIVADPLFVDATADFHLMPTSPAVRAAIPAADLQPDHDFEGTPRHAPFDIGAFAFQP